MVPLHLQTSVDAVQKKKKKKSNGTRPHTVGPIKDQGSSAAPFLGCKNARWGPPLVFVCLELVQKVSSFFEESWQCDIVPCIYFSLILTKKCDLEA